MEREISEVAKEIIEIEFNMDMTLSEGLSKFFDIMRKYQIKEGTPAFNDRGEKVGRNVANWEWTMCKALFFDILGGYIEMETMIGDVVPTDLKE